MEQNEIDAVKEFINKTSSIDFSFLSLKNENGEAINITRLNNRQILNIITTAIVQFQNAIELGIIYSLPRLFYRREHAGPKLDIITELSGLIQNLSHEHLPGIEQNALQIQSYLLTHGMMSVSNEPSLLRSENEIKLLSYKNQALYEEIKKTEDELGKMKNSIHHLKQQSDALFEKSRIEYSQINTNLQATLKIKESLDRLEKELVYKKKDFENTLSNTETLIKNSINRVNEQEERNSFVLKQIENLANTGNTITSEVGEQRIMLKNITEETLNLQVELKKLLSPAIAFNLQNTFKMRKKWLFISTLVWGSITIALTSVMAWYISKIFDNKEFSFETQKVIVSTIKLIPIITLIYFAIRQFNKSRNLEEEYAFRESIATSLMHYAEQIKTKPEEKESLIKTTVEKLYSSPTIKSENQNILLSKNGPELKQLLEIVKEVKEMSK